MGSILAALTGLSAGIVSGSALCALYIALGIITKSATSLGVRRITKPILFSFTAGGILATAATIFGLSIKLGIIMSSVYGLFAGIFIGILIGCIADVVSSISIIKNFGISNKSIIAIIIAFGVGKLIGSMVYWISGVF